MEKVVVLDFDGTITDAEMEGIPFVLGFYEDLALLNNQKITDILKLMKQFENMVISNPDEYGWEVAGKIVAPAVVDPYLRTRPVATMFLEKMGMEKRFILPLLDLLFYYNYPKTDIVFKQDAAKILQAIKPYNVYIVTNAKTEPIMKKIDALIAENFGKADLLWLKDRLIGLAKKYVIDDDFPEVPETLSIPNLRRKIYLRRYEYFKVLNMLRERHQVNWEDMYVVGDIFELDLCLPDALGAKVGLVANEYTPAYEKDFVARQKNGRVFTGLLQILDFIQE